MAALKIENLITDHLDLWTAAVRPKSSAGRGSNSKLELTGIKKLRELILELAVRGKLVPQDPSDEPASVLLERIAAEKAQLVRDGKIKSEKKYPVISDAEQPHSKPDGWVFERFGNVLINRDFERIPLAVSERERRKGGYDYYGASGVIDRIDGYLFDKPLLLIGEDGANLINRSSPIAFIARGQYWVNNHAHVLDGLNEDLLKYVCLHINAISLLPYITGTAQPKMNQAKMNTIVLGIPPLAEQKRIVAKVDELMALCDQLEQRSESQLAAHQTLVETLLATLTDSGDADELEQNWARLSNHFDTLFTTETSIDALKQTILQLAVMGKLVPQDPSDEPAAALLERIAAEKARLVKEKAIRKPSSMSPIGELPQPFNMPSGWEWVRLGDICHTIADGPHFSPKYVEKNEGVAFLSARNISAESIDLVTAKYVSREDHESFCKRVRVKLGDVLYTKGGTTGIAKVNDIETEFSVWVHVAVLQIPLDKVCNNYLALALNSPHCYTQSQVYTHGIGNKDLGLTRMINITIPFPPLTEQYRIISKVDALMSLCDQLKASLKANQQTQLALAESLVEGALA
ncbi:restriction endonuclease subunit S [Aeromonas veronii]|uniref:restriction endonuclease subunit S n=1 Tax=Aeromonas veronii TaxID=654 RepID=UPI001F2AA5BD|nr:restriction endonuclease subunit S [Aeromonas veronii]